MLYRSTWATSASCLSRSQLYLDLLVFSIAGVDTSSTAISYTLWELSRRPDIVRKLQPEIDDAMHDPKIIPDISVLNQLPVLNAIIKESESLSHSRLSALNRCRAALRIYGSAPDLLERVVPAEGTELLGCAIPAGTIVATQSWSLQRNTDVFPSPNTYLPDRWLDADADALREMDAHMMPFGVGLRICAGLAFAQQDLRIVLATIVRNFDVHAPPETNERTMEQRDAFVRDLHLLRDLGLMFYRFSGCLPGCDALQNYSGPPQGVTLFIAFQSCCSVSCMLRRSQPNHAVNSTFVAFVA
jgi:cytochrome P450